MIVTYDAIKYIMFTIACESGDNVSEEWWYVFLFGVSIRVDVFLMKEEKLVVVDVMVTYPTLEKLIV